MLDHNPFLHFFDRNDIHIPLYEDVTVIEMGNTMQISHMSFHNPKPATKKLAGGKYENLRTGEIFESRKKTSTKRTESPVSLKRTFQKIGRIIQANVGDPEKVRWVTLTYKENMTDGKQLYEDFRRFYGRLKTYCKRNKWSSPEYISIAEPQARGAWHLHVFLIWKDQVAPFIPNSDLEGLWRHGYTKIKSLKDSDNIAGYLVAYLSDIPTEELPKAKGELAINKKKYVKHGRLQLYPAGFNIIRHSKGIIIPKPQRMSGFKAFAMVRGAPPSYHCRKEFLVAGMYDSTFQLVEFKRNADGSWGNPQNDGGDWEYDLTNEAYHNHHKK